MGCVIAGYWLFVLIIAGILERTTGHWLLTLIWLAAAALAHLIAHLLHAGERPEQPAPSDQQRD